MDLEFNKMYTTHTRTKKNRKYFSGMYLRFKKRIKQINLIKRSRERYFGIKIIIGEII